ncbi:MAG: enoyl-CoA hydratase/carnithine racemase [Francisellaceae bacterium]|jgi:enoyl-CoA hydratase/carnithine racemase
MQMFNELDSISKKLKKRRDIRAIIFQGNGRASSPRLDVKSISSFPLIMALMKWTSLL